MPISVNGGDALISAIDGALQRMRTAVLDRLCRVGERAVDLQRGGHKYIDRTGNLTSSIGYVVLDKGHVYRASSFKSKAGSEGTGTEGSAAGKALIEELARKYATDDIALVIVAGMEYASYVEAKGLNVLDTAQLHVIGNAEREVEKAVQTTLKVINEMLK